MLSCFHVSESADQKICIAGANSLRTDAPRTFAFSWFSFRIALKSPLRTIWKKTSAVFVSFRTKKRNILWDSFLLFKADWFKSWIEKAAADNQEIQSREGVDMCRQHFHRTHLISHLHRVNNHCAPCWRSCEELRQDVSLRTAHTGISRVKKEIHTKQNRKGYLAPNINLQTQKHPKTKPELVPAMCMKALGFMTNTCRTKQLGAWRPTWRSFPFSNFKSIRNWNKPQYICHLHEEKLRGWSKRNSTNPRTNPCPNA